MFVAVDAEGALLYEDVSPAPGVVDGGTTCAFTITTDIINAIINITFFIIFNITWFLKVKL
jgi:hypothetical protein